jgi:hypothetical protein
MLTFEKTLELAATWVRITSDDRLAIIRNRTLAKPYGWIFFYGSRDRDERIAGNAPIIVDRIDGEIRVTGTAQSLDTYLRQYEATLPPARLQMSVPKAS